MDCDSAAAIGAEEFRHEVGVALGTAEAQCALAPVDRELFKGVLSARPSRESIG